MMIHHCCSERCYTNPTTECDYYTWDIETGRNNTSDMQSTMKKNVYACMTLLLIIIPKSWQNGTKEGESVIHCHTQSKQYIRLIKRVQKKPEACPYPLILKTPAHVTTFGLIYALTTSTCQHSKIKSLVEHRELHIELEAVWIVLPSSYLIVSWACVWTCHLDLQYVDVFWVVEHY